MHTPQKNPDGYLALPQNGNGGAVLVLHAWWGLNDTIKHFCDRLAESGFVAFAPDLYHGRVADAIARARELATELDSKLEQARADIADAVAVLTERDGASDRGIAVVGFSLGAYYALDLSITDPENVRSVVAFYGSWGGDYSTSRAAYLGHFAENDDFEPRADVDAMEAALERARRPVHFYHYAGVGHWFFEPDRTDAFNEAAATLAWDRTLAFLHESLSTSSSDGAAPASPKLGPDDPRYRAVVDKRFNKRFSGSPDYVRVVTSTAQVVSAVQDAVDEKRRVVATSGGHCLEGFVVESDVRVIIDVTPMKRVYFDAERRAIAVEAGATVGEAFKALHDTWRTVIPLGEYPGIGIGGHVVGGAFGFLCRELGLAADYLYAVEVVTVNKDGRAGAVIATREKSDPNRELWWAHTGGGGGNFGIVTRYWFRSLDATGDDPARLLPRAPKSITTFKAEWSWSDMSDASFLRLLQNHGAWCEENSGADSPNASLTTLLEIHRKQSGKIIVRGASTAGEAAERQWNEQLAALSAGIKASRGREIDRMSWLDFALNPWPELFTLPPGGASMKAKDAMLRKRFTDRQIGVAYDYLTRADFDVMGGVFGLATYGGRVNTVASDATASAHRGSILDTACNVGWLDKSDEAQNLKWVRDFYRELFADTGGVPTPGDAYDGALINHPDTDLADPKLNTSGVPWSTIYYRKNYPRLQKVKSQWDPRDVFHHALSIRPG